MPCVRASCSISSDAVLLLAGLVLHVCCTFIAIYSTWMLIIRALPSCCSGWTPAGADCCCAVFSHRKFNMVKAGTWYDSHDSHGYRRR